MGSICFASLREEVIYFDTKRKSDAMSEKKTLVLFDVDGTLTAARQQIKSEMHDLLQNKLKPKVAIGLVSGSDLVKVSEQMGKDCMNEFDFVFPENGLVAYENGVEIGRQSIAKFMGEEKLQKFINFCLGYMSKLELPVKRGTFVEFRNGLINICPPGRSVSQADRDNFAEVDSERNIRKTFVEKRFEKIYFYGDRTSEGGNDYHIYADERTDGRSVINPEDTMRQLTQEFDL